MPSPVKVSRERLIAASPDLVWSVVANPAMNERLDRRNRLESTSGEAGQVSSQYVLAVRSGGVVTVRLRYLVVESEASTRWAADVYRDSKLHAQQRATLSRSGDSTLLRWDVTVWAGPLTRPLVLATCRKELPSWLAAIERQVVAAA